MEKSFYLLNSQETQVSWEEVMMVVETEPSAYILYTKRLEPLTICKPYTCFVFILIAAATSDITVSLAWCPYDSNVLITGQGPKYIRAFDIRGERSVKLVGWSSVISRHIHNYAIDTALYGLISWIIHTIWLVHTYDLLDNRHIDDITINKILLLYHIKLIDSILLWVCTMVDHRKIVEIW